MLLAGGQYGGVGVKGMGSMTGQIKLPICNPRIATVMPLEDHSSTAFSQEGPGLYCEGVHGLSVCYEGHMTTAFQCPHLV